MKETTPTVITDPSEISSLVARIAKCSRVGMDIEFLSADRLIPELCLVQLVWEEDGEQELALVDGIGTELGPLYELLNSGDILVVAHGAKQDLQLLGFRSQVELPFFVDTQIAAAFAGIAEQVGYGNLVEQVVGKKLDKGSQFTDWTRRPLSAKQLRYALDDVRYLLPAWDHLQRILAKGGRLEWAREESALLAQSACTRRPSEEAYLSMGGAKSLRGSALGALRELARWRDEKALAENSPPSWIFPDAACIESCRRNLKKESDILRLKGVSRSMVEKNGAAVLAAMAKGRLAPADSVGPAAGLDSAGQVQASVVAALVASRAAQMGMMPKTIAAKVDCEALVLSARGEDIACRLLNGWRREAAGQVAMDWVQGRGQLLANSKYGVEIAGL